jgi:hypothetical protein
VLFTVHDPDGEIVRHLTGPSTAGFHRVAWDLRYPALRPWRPGEDTDEAERDGGVLVAPGTFEVTMQLRRDGELAPVGEPRTVVVESIRSPALPGRAQAVRVEFGRRVADLDRVVEGTVATIDRLLEELDGVKAALRRSTAELGLRRRADDLASALLDQREHLEGDRLRRRMGDLGPVPVSQRLSFAAFGSRTNAYGPTPAQEEALTLARQQFDEVEAVLRGAVERDLEALRRDLDDAGVPWTPGRGL